MITIQEWKAMSGKEKTIFLQDNCKANGKLRKRCKTEGFGLNDAKYVTQPTLDGSVVQCPAYRLWAGIIKRCNNAKIHERHPTYIGVSVCDEWASFSVFRTWWIDNQVDGFALDKDILSDDGIYSPDTCLFVPQWLNNFTLDKSSARGEWPIGVYLNKSSGRFQSQCKNPITNKIQYLGLFDTPEEAHLAWRTRKLDLAIELKPKIDEIDLRIYPRIVEIISNAK